MGRIEIRIGDRDGHEDWNTTFLIHRMGPLIRWALTTSYHQDSVLGKTGPPTVLNGWALPSTS